MKSPLLAVLALFALSVGCDEGAEFGSPVRSQEPPKVAAAQEKVETSRRWSGPATTAHVRPAKPAGGIHVPTRTFVEWEFDKHPQPVRYAMGEMKVIVKGVPSDVLKDDFMLHVEIEAPGRPAAMFEQYNVDLHFPVLLGFGSLDREGTPYLLVKSYSGGPHCCTNLDVAIARPSKIQIVRADSWDGEPLARFPSDHDGDGLTDFILRDGAFNYAFEAYSHSWPPTQIMNIAGGDFVDVSTRPGFRDLFIAEMREARRLCLDRKEAYPDGFCAGYAASAARAGQFRKAWAEIARRRGPGSDWKLHPVCKESRMRLGCPRAYQDGANTYLDALRAHLKRFDYIA